MDQIILSGWEVLIGSLIFIISTLWGVYQYFQNQRHAVEVERLKYSLEVQKNQQILNDERYRKAYEDFINIFVSMLKDTKEAETDQEKAEKLKRYVERMYDFIETSLLFAWPNTIKSFWDYKRFSNLEKENKNPVAVFDIMWKLLLSMRQDLWVYNWDLDEKDIFQTIANFDIKDL